MIPSWRTAAAFLVFLAFLTLPRPPAAVAQNFGNIPPQTVLGNPSPTATQPARPIPFTSTCSSIVNYGGNGDGVTDNGAALTAALAANPATQKCIAFPPGQFKFTSTFSYSYPSGGATAAVTLAGAGSDVTQLIGPSGASLLALTMTSQLQSFHVRDMSLVAVNPCAGCTALSVTQTGTLAAQGASGWSDVTHVSLVGSDRSPTFPGGVNYWETGIDLNGVSNTNFNDVFINGVQTTSEPTPGTSRGVYLHGDAGHIPVQFNFVNTSINVYSRGIDFGPYVQGVALVNTNLVGNQVGVYVSAVPGQNAAQLSISNSQINACSAIYVPPVTPGTGGAINYLTLADSVIINTGQPYPCGSTYTTAVFLGNGAPFSLIRGDIFNGGSGFTGVSIWGPADVAGEVTNNMMSGFNIGIDTTSTPVTTTGGMIIANNVMLGNTTAIMIGNVTQKAVVTGNQMQGNGTDLLNNSGDVYANYVDIPQDCALQSVFSFNGGTAGIVLAHNYCQISTVNQQTFIDFDFQLSNIGTSTGQAQLVLGPVQPAMAPGGSAVISLAGGLTGLTGALTGIVNPSSATLQFGMMNSAGTGQLTNVNFTNGARIVGRVAMHAPTP